MSRYMYGFYSAQAERMLSGDIYASYIQVGPNGERVTAWYSTPEAASYKWPDKQFIGYFDTHTFHQEQLNPGASQEPIDWDEPEYSYDFPDELMDEGESDEDAWDRFDDNLEGRK